MAVEAGKMERNRHAYHIHNELRFATIVGGLTSRCSQTAPWRNNFSMLATDPPLRGLSHLIGRVSVSTTVCTALFVPLATLCPTFFAVSAVFFATLAALRAGPAPTVPMETATARMIEKNVFMVLKYRCRQLVCVYRLSPRCASATKIVRLCESTPETQPQLQPALVKLLMISQYFTRLAF
jgi:hypothetical protein